MKCQRINGQLMKDADISSVGHLSFGHEWCLVRKVCVVGASHSDSEPYLFSFAGVILIVSCVFSDAFVSSSLRTCSSNPLSSVSCRIERVFLVAIVSERRQRRVVAALIWSRASRGRDSRSSSCTSTWTVSLCRSACAQGRTSAVCNTSQIADYF